MFGVWCLVRQTDHNSMEICIEECVRSGPVVCCLVPVCVLVAFLASST